jgi:hypothetical protein
MVLAKSKHAVVLSRRLILSGDARKGRTTLQHCCFIDSVHFDGCSWFEMTCSRSSSSSETCFRVSPDPELLKVASYSLLQAVQADQVGRDSKPCSRAHVQAKREGMQSVLVEVWLKPGSLCICNLRAEAADSIEAACSNSAHTSLAEKKKGVRLVLRKRKAFDWFLLEDGQAQVNPHF